MFDGLVSVEPDEEDFLKFLKTKHQYKSKPQINLNKVKILNYLFAFYEFIILFFFS